VRETRIPWLAEATDRLRLLHVEVEATMRRISWGEELDHEHFSAFINAVLECDRIKSALIKHISAIHRQHADDNSIASVNRSLATMRRLATGNGNGHVNGAG
jgi:hypothetical protein